MQAVDLNKCRIYRETISIVLKTNKVEYELVDFYRNINNKRIRRLYVVNIANYAFTQKGEPVVTNIDAIGDAQLYLYGMKQNELVVNGESLANYYLDGSTNIYPFPGVFPDAPEIDWSKSKVVYPNTTTVNAQNDKAFQWVVEYYDIPD